MTCESKTTTKPLTDRIKHEIESGRVSLPPLPRLVTHLRNVLKDESRASSSRVAEAVRNEPAVTATLLKMANSVVFGGLQQISDLSQAIARLGFHHVTSVVTTVAHSSHFKSDDVLKQELHQTLWSHAVSTALAAKRLAGLDGGDPEESYIAGLLHDSGKLLVLKAIDYLECKGRTLDVTDIVMDELMDVLHTELGHHTLVAWRLPEPICEVALRHHDENVGLEKPLVLRVQAADAISRKLGEHPKPDPEMDLLDLACIQRLNVSDIELASLMVDLEDEVAEIKTLI